MLLHARMSRFTYLMLHFKDFCVNSNSLNLLLLVMNIGHGSVYNGTVKQHFQCFDISRGLGDRTERDRELVPQVCSYHDQIITFDWMWIT